METGTDSDECGLRAAVDVEGPASTETAVARGKMSGSDWKGLKAVVALKKDWVW